MYSVYGIQIKRDPFFLSNSRRERAQLSLGGANRTCRCPKTSKCESSSLFTYI